MGKQEFRGHLASYRLMTTVPRSQGSYQADTQQVLHFRKRSYMFVNVRGHGREGSGWSLGEPLGLAAGLPALQGGG